MAVAVVKAIPLLRRDTGSSPSLFYAMVRQAYYLTRNGVSWRRALRGMTPPFSRQRIYPVTIVMASAATDVPGTLARRLLASGAANARGTLLWFPSLPLSLPVGKDLVLLAPLCAAHVLFHTKWLSTMDPKTFVLQAMSSGKVILI